MGKIATTTKWKLYPRRPEQVPGPDDNSGDVSIGGNKDRGGLNSKPLYEDDKKERTGGTCNEDKVGGKATESSSLPDLKTTNTDGDGEDDHEPLQLLEGKIEKANVLLSSLYAKIEETSLLLSDQNERKLLQGDHQPLLDTNGINQPESDHCESDGEKLHHAQDQQREVPFADNKEESTTSGDVLVADNKEESTKRKSNHDRVQETLLLPLALTERNLDQDGDLEEEPGKDNGIKGSEPISEALNGVDRSDEKVSPSKTQRSVLRKQMTLPTALNDTIAREMEPLCGQREIKSLTEMLECASPALHD